MAAGAIALGLGSIISGMFSGIANWFNTMRTNQQNQRNYEDWKQYNSPVNQMSRLQEAGLNPYMINGMNNTLSEPFNVQSNTGISQMFSNMSQAMAGASGNINTAQANQIKRDNLKLQELNSEVRRRLTETNIKNGNYYGALLMSQGTIAELNAAAAQQLFSDKLDRYRMQNQLLLENLNYARGVNPLKLQFYSDYYPEFIRNLKARTDYTNNANYNLSFYRKFDQYKFEKELENIWYNNTLRAKLGFGNLYNGSQLGWSNLSNNADLSLRRLGIQDSYLNLAEQKFWTNLGLKFMDFGSDWRR